MHGTSPLGRISARLVVALAALAALAAGVGSAAAQDPGPSLEERKAILRALPAEERMRLRAELERFRALPKDEQEALRRKAREIGPERLGGLAGRDVEFLKRRHDALTVEIDRVMEIVGEARLQPFGAEERAYLRAEATRGFQRHVKKRLLFLAGYTRDDQFDGAPHAEKRAALATALDRLEAQQLAPLPDGEQARIRALPARERAAERARLLTEWRMHETLTFSKLFDARRVEEFRRMSPEDRQAQISRWRERSRWFEAKRVLREEIGLREAWLVRLSQLPPAGWARVLFEVRSTEDVAVEDRRLRIEQLIDQLHGRAAIDATPVPPLARVLQERRGAPGPHIRAPR